MSTVQEIEAVIERLPAEQVKELLVWPEEYQGTINASSDVFSILDAEEQGDSWASQPA